MSRFLVTLGAILIAAGVVWPWLHKLGLGCLPGDFVIERQNLRLYIPLTTSLLVSGVVSVFLWLLRR